MGLRISHCCGLGVAALFIASLAAAAPAVSSGALVTPAAPGGSLPIFLHGGDSACAAGAAGIESPFLAPRPEPRVTLFCGVCSVSACQGRAVNASCGAHGLFCNVGTTKCSQDQNWQCICSGVQ